MTPTAWVVLVVTVVAAVLLISERVRPDLAAMVVMVFLGISGITTPQETFSGFGGSAVITLVGISVISEGLHQTGVARRLGEMMHHIGKQREWLLVLVVTLTSATLSLFMNNIAVVGVLLPAVMALSRRSKTNPSRLLMPLAYGTILGGMATLLTTSNIIVSGALRDAGFQPFGLLDFFPIGAPIVLAGALYIVTLGRRLIPSGVKPSGAVPEPARRPEFTDLYRLGETLREMTILPGSSLAGHTLAESNLAQRTNLLVLGIIRQKSILPAPCKDEIIRVGDTLLVQGNVDEGQLEALGLVTTPSAAGQSSIMDGSISMAEVILPPHSHMTGRTLRQLDFRDRYGLSVLAIWRDGKPVQTGFVDLRLREGDALLVYGQANRIHAFLDEPGFILLHEDPDAVLVPKKSRLALVIMFVTLGFAAIGLLPVAVVVMAGAVLMLITGCLNMNDIYRRMEWKAIFLIAGMWPLSIAIRSTGLADAAMQALFSQIGTLTPLLLAAILLLIALVFTQVMSGQVAALVLAPLALSAAAFSGVDPRGMAMAVALGCSLAFPTPYGHPVNLIVMGAGGYRFRDYLRAGLPLTVLVFCLILAGLKLFWGF